ncbi:hypothetical protein [Halovenus marina]|uniref:hypothetical protein n=1 Tax=Halovenus marina TaxID=3396621 RepID=UPI003F557B22
MSETDGSADESATETDSSGGDESTAVAESTAPRGDSRGLYGIIVGLAINVSLAIATMFGFEELAATPEFFALWAAGNFLILPVGLYIDARQLKRTSDWTGTPLIWGGLAAIPAVNIAVAAFYLSIRGSTDRLVGGADV